MEINDIISSGLLEAYILGLSSAEENTQVQSWMKLYPEVANEVNDIERTMEAYAMANAIEPVKATKEKIFNTVNSSALQNNNTAIVRPISSVWKWAAAAAAVLLIGSMAINVVYYNKYDKANAALAAQNEKISDMSNDMNDMSRDMNVVQSRYSEPVALHGLEAAPDAAAKIFWMKNTGEVYIDPTNLPDAPNGKQYQLWAIVDGKPVDGGMIVKTKKGDKYQIQKMKTFGKAEAFAVTLETAGGNPTPKGTMFVMGKM